MGEVGVGSYEANRISPASIKRAITTTALPNLPSGLLVVVRFRSDIRLITCCVQVEYLPTPGGAA